MISDIELKAACAGERIWVKDDVVYLVETEGATPVDPPELKGTTDLRYCFWSEKAYAAGKIPTHRINPLGRLEAEYQHPVVYRDVVHGKEMRVMMVSAKRVDPTYKWDDLEFVGVGTFVRLEK